MVRQPYFDSNGMKKGAWSEEEDNKLRDYIQRHGHVPNWRLLPIFAGLARCGKSCRLRWVNYLKPGLKRGNFTKHEKDLIIKLHAQLGNKWSAIATNLPGRTDNEIKNFWHAHIQKRYKRKGYVSKRLIKTETGKEELSYSEINFCSINQTETPLNNRTPQGLLVENLENFSQGSNVMTEDYQTCDNLSSPFAKGELIDNFWLCDEMQKNNMSLVFESSDGGYPNAGSQLEDFWAGTLGEEAISWYFGDIMNMLQP